MKTDSMIKLFDSYNIRARISTVIFLLAPIIFPLYLFVPEIRVLSTTIITLIIGFSICNVLISCSRTFGKKAKKTCFPDMYPAQEMLLPSDCSLDDQTKLRYQNYLCTHLKDISFCGTENEIKKSSNTAIKWLVSRTRDAESFPLIYEENINFGFACNLYGMKSIGIICCSVIVFAELAAIYLTVNGKITSLSLCNLLISAIITVLFLIMWVFMVTKNWVLESGRRYGYALLSACDSDMLNGK